MRIKERKKQLFLTMGKMYKKGFAKCTKCTMPQNKWFIDKKYLLKGKKKNGGFPAAVRLVVVFNFLMFRLFRLTRQ